MNMCTHVSLAARNEAKRQCVNTKCQGSAADIVKLAMIRIRHRLHAMQRREYYHQHRSHNTVKDGGSRNPPRDGNGDVKPRKGMDGQVNHCKQGNLTSIRKINTNANNTARAVTADAGTCVEESATVARLVCQIHDELLFEVRKDCLRKVMRMVKTEMEDVYKHRLRYVYSMPCVHAFVS